MLVLVNLLYYCSGANLGRCTNIQIQEKWKMFNIYTFNTLYLNRELGEGGGLFLLPRDPTSLFSMNRDVRKHRCVVWLKWTPWNANCYSPWLWIVNTKRIHIHWTEEIKSCKQFFFLLFFSASKGKREVERQGQHLFCKGIKLKIRLKNITVLFNMNISFIKTNIS